LKSQVRAHTLLVIISHWWEDLEVYIPKFFVFLKKRWICSLCSWRKNNLFLVFVKKRRIYSSCSWRNKNFFFVFLKKEEFVIHVLQQRRNCSLCSWTIKNMFLGDAKRFFPKAKSGNWYPSKCSSLLKFNLISNGSSHMFFIKDLFIGIRFHSLRKYFDLQSYSQQLLSECALLKAWWRT
jgi:hypothetical protein